LEIYNKWSSFDGFGKIKKIIRKQGLTPLYQSLDIETLEYTHIYFQAPQESRECIWRFDKEKRDKIYYSLFLTEKPVFWESLFDFFEIYQVAMIQDFVANYNLKYPNKNIKYLYFYADPETGEVNDFLMGTQIG
jgi:hypothetical protein